MTQFGRHSVVWLLHCAMSVMLICEMLQIYVYIKMFFSVHENGPHAPLL